MEEIFILEAVYKERKIFYDMLHMLANIADTENSGSKLHCIINIMKDKMNIQYLEANNAYYEALNTLMDDRPLSLNEWDENPASFSKGGYENERKN